ncbi:MAG: xanthine dehydrogenase family protein molybdopterin-binding subunit [Bacteroidia bacterium]
MKRFFDSPLTSADQKGRVEGRKKVTGQARYSAEYNLPEIVYGVLVGSTIAKGKVVQIHTEEALAQSGVIDIITHKNVDPVENLASEEKFEKIRLSFPIFHTDKILQNDQHIALVLAESIEEAHFAASLVYADYEAEEPEADFGEKMKETELEEVGKERGSLDAWQDAAHVVEEEYTIAMEVHNPMEMHATTAQWSEDNHIILHEKSQNVRGVQRLVSKIFDLPAEQVRVNSEFVGGGFGAGLVTWPHAIAAIIAAKRIKRPVKVLLSRQQMFTQVGYRPESWQRVRIGADAKGTLLGIHHQAKHSNSRVNSFFDNITGISRKIYAFEHVKTEQGRTLLDIPAPIWMRGPGDASGCFAAESAIDQLCYDMNMDPVDIRLNNIAPHEMESGLPYSSNFLKECIRKGAENIGWKNRSGTPGSIKERDWMVGYGHAVGLWNAWRVKASASAELTAEGVLILRTSMTDIGTGTGQGMLNVAHNSTGIPKENIRIHLGDSDFPTAPSQGGSAGMASISAAVIAACDELKKSLASTLSQHSDTPDAIRISATGIYAEGASDKETAFRELFEQIETDSINVMGSSGPGEERKKFGFVSSAAHFCKVRVHEATGRVKIDRYVSVVDGGKIINQQAAANQIIGAVMGGIGMALLEDQYIDPRSGRLIGNDFAGYHFPVNASAPIIEVEFINKPDPNISASGAKGIGEVGLIGMLPPSPTRSIMLLEGDSGTCRLRQIRFWGRRITMEVFLILQPVKNGLF